MLKNNTFKRVMACGAFFASCAISLPAMAGSSTGTIGVSMNVSAACAVNGGSQTSGSLGQIGSISFADQAGIIGTVDASLVPSAGTGGIAVLCSPGLTPSVTVGAGANDSGGVRHLNSSGSQIAYKLYSDAGRSSEITIGQQISLGTTTTSSITVPIYGRVLGGGVSLAAGSYTDAIQVTLNW